MRQKLAALRKRWEKHTSSTFDFRIGMLLILSCSTLVAWLFDATLLFVGIEDISTRYLTAITFGYAVFFLFTKLWFFYALDETPVVHKTNTYKHSGLSLSTVESCLDIADVASNVYIETDFPHLGYTHIDHGASAVKESGIVGDTAGAIFSDEHGVILALLGGFVAALIGVAIYLLYYAPEILSDSLFNYYIANYRPDLSRVATEGWFGTLLASTFGPFVLMLLFATMIASLILTICPEAIVLSQALALI